MWKKCKVISLKANGITNLVDYAYGYGYSFGVYAQPCPNTALCEDEEYIHLYFISDDEIEMGDWFYGSNHIWKWTSRTSKPNLDGCKKVIASTDPSLNLLKPSDDFIREYCEEGGIDEVMVEYIIDEVMSIRKPELNDTYKDDYLVYMLKINSDNTINIKKIKDNWSREEVISIIHNYRIEMGVMGNCNVNDCDNWIDENL